MSDSQNEAVKVYEKGDRRVVAKSPTHAVSLEFDGYSLAADNTTGSEPAPDNSVDYRDLQEQAKELGIKANQSADELQSQIDAMLAEGGHVDAPETDSDDTGTDPNAVIPPA